MKKYSMFSALEAGELSELNDRVELEIKRIEKHIKSACYEGRDCIVITLDEYDKSERNKILRALRSAGYTITIDKDGLLGLGGRFGTL